MRATLQPRLGQATEDYLKAIFKLQEGIDPVSTNRVADYLRVSPAAVTKALRHLAQKKLINYTPYYGVTLTRNGRMTALEVIRHHRLLELFLHDVLGFGWDEVDAEAERLEHHISEKFEERIDRLLNYPSFDPHGDPIPSRDGRVSAHRDQPLAECTQGETVIVRRVRDGNPEALRYLDRLGLRPGVVLEVLDKQPFAGPLTLRTGSATHPVGQELAGHVFVESVARDDHK